MIKRNDLTSSGSAADAPTNITPPVEVDITEEVFNTYLDAFNKAYDEGKASTAHGNGLRAAARLIVSAELELLVEEMESRPVGYSITSDDIRARIAELRGGAR